MPPGSKTVRGPTSRNHSRSLTRNGGAVPVVVVVPALVDTGVDVEGVTPQTRPHETKVTLVTARCCTRGSGVGQVCNGCRTGRVGARRLRGCRGIDPSLPAFTQPEGRLHDLEAGRGAGQASVSWLSGDEGPSAAACMRCQWSSAASTTSANEARSLANAAAENFDRS